MLKGWILLITLSWGAVSSMAPGALQAKGTPPGFQLNAAPVITNSLGRVFDKLNSGSGITIAYLGGSITLGDAASNDETTSYRALTTRWFRDTYPEKTIKAVNAGIGGTGSQLGSFRVQHDILSKATPDLTFVEFAVNDYAGVVSGAYSQAQVQRSMEGIVRQLFGANPDMEIVFVYTVSAIPTPSPTGDRSSWADYASSVRPPTIVAHAGVARKYGIQGINVGYALYQAALTTSRDASRYLLDGVHPNDMGHRVYANEIIRVLKLGKNDSPRADHAILPPSVVANPTEHGRYADAATVGTRAFRAPGWVLENSDALFNSPTKPSYPKWLRGPVGTPPLTYTFTGTDVGILFAWKTNVGATISYSIDGSPWMNSWNTGADTNRINPVFFSAISDGSGRYAPFVNGIHTLQIKPVGAGWLYVFGPMSHRPAAGTSTLTPNFSRASGESD